MKSETLVQAGIRFALGLSVGFMLMAPLAQAALSEGGGGLGSVGLSADKISQDQLQARKSIVFGHNLSITNQVLRRGDFSLGTYALAVGLTDSITVAASPWIYAGYGLYNFGARVNLQQITGMPLTFQAMYFKSAKTSESIIGGRGIPIIMEAVSSNLAYTSVLNQHASVHYNLNLMYFWDETAPFSLRREPRNNNPYQITVSALYVTKVTANVNLIGEMGVHGVNYAYPQALMGASLSWQNPNWLAQFGFSVTSTPKALFSSVKIDNTYVNINRPLSDWNLELDFSLHPEIQLQYSF